MNPVVKVIRKPGFWFIVALLALISLPYYREALAHPAFLNTLMAKLQIERHAFERILYLAPIIWAGFIFGWKGAVLTSLAALALMLPRVFLISSFPRDSLFESAAVFILGNVIAFGFDALSKSRERRAQLEKAQKELQAHVEVIRESEKRLAALHQISSTVSRSLDLSEVLNSAIDNAMDVMKVDVGWIFLFDEDTRMLTLAAYRGAPEEFALGVDKLKLGEGFSGRVAESGQPMVITDASSDPRLTREVVAQQHIRTTLIVPLSSKGRVSGTLCVAMRSLRNFEKEEIELLTAIGNQISVAIENARLYEHQRFYLQQATRAQEEERKRISRELHDETIQSLVALSRKLDALASTGYGLPEKVRSSIEELWQQTNGIMKEVRRLSQDLRPAALDRLGLLSALEWLAADISQYSGIETKVKVTGTERRFSEEVELVLFRITQEALRNVWRHSGATRADILVTFDQEKTTITVTDNGRGFDIPGNIGDLARHSKLGLAGMQERARLVGGSLSVQSEPGKGTTVTVEMPLNTNIKESV